MDKKNVSLVILGLCLLLPAAARAQEGSMAARMGSADPAVRKSAALDAGNRKSVAAVPGLIALLNDQSQGVVVTAVVALGQIRDPRAVDPLIEAAVKSTYTAVRVMAAQSLGYFEGEKPLAALAGIADDQAPAVRGAACRSLGKLGGGKEADKLIEKAGGDADPQVRRTAVETLVEMAELKPLGGRRTAIENALKAAAKDKDGKTRASADKALQRLKRTK
ncbi:MAG: HEAT repeat domain-containing protein [Elusimicrobiales bacterium]|nr:HEAT repeat domain-containing protein [Elusimicrobiales bacterium]